MQDLILNFLATNPHLAVVLTVLAVLRAVLKPIMAALEAGVQASGSDQAKKILAQCETSAVYKVLSFVLDYTASIKLPVIQASLAGKAPQA